MDISIPRIKLRIEGIQLRAFYAIASEFESCGKIGGLGLIPNKKEIQNFKLNDRDFECVYHGILRAMDGPRYSTKTGNEYSALQNLLKLFELEFLNQRGYEFTYKNRSD